MRLAIEPATFLHDRWTLNGYTTHIIQLRSGSEWNWLFMFQILLEIVRNFAVRNTSYPFMSDIIIQPLNMVQRILFA